ncbi:MULTISPECIES: GNAT family N-acetyltransferase [Vibrio]|uniref:GNAT family N-acetyltransferase n=1 Tax=Vibrio TaxID=662 RepID=UPI0019D4A9D6|nr:MULTISPECIES: GNAT family N-acetyltransferase [Vibrio]MBN8095508.1 GNAT family N-acetyltransferase [Vibrio vulnificus]MCF8781127.1 GNAT family N-acetyltransferase [Vibrio floridensis]HAS6050811.1 GNAT family N-acetyltransferase [Vibrio vulnificus]HAS6055473.1 GNAT family N-acetyltransferase [Vibrio vulnificus]HAS6102535.1 GNAT family N-acetyltransferase [Vibrio vulnificus]
MEYIIRSASESDASGINEVSEHLGYSQLSSTESTTKLHELLNSTQDQVFVAEWQGRIIGWLHLFYARRLASDNFFEIGGLVVSPESRGHGVGRALVQHAQAKDLGKLRVRCNEKRLDAHNFYKSIGFNSNKVQRVFQVRS